MTIPLEDELAMRRKFGEYLIAVGRVAHEWNYLQELLGKLFASVISGSHDIILLAVWYSEQNDRAQRRLLRAAINAEALQTHKSAPPSATEDILWVLEEADKLGARRDEALHAPFAIRLEEGGSPDVIAAYFQGNPLARRLKGKDIMSDLALSAWRAAQLRSYVEAIDRALKEIEPPWPDKRPFAISRRLTAAPWNNISRDQSLSRARQPALQFRAFLVAHLSLL